jgi:hypothetical protein
VKTSSKFLLALLLAASAISDAHAMRWYSPSTGRWFNRDPIGEPGFQVLQNAQRTFLVKLMPPSQQSTLWKAHGTVPISISKRMERRGSPLYVFVSNNPIDWVDYLGLVAEAPNGPAGHCQDPCGDAKRQGLDVNLDGEKDDGGVICCGGKKYTCVWGTGNATNPKAKWIIATCIAVHEYDHLNEVDCPACWKRGFPTRPPSRNLQDWDANECSAYKAELQCLQSRFGGCGGDPDCEEQVTDAIQNAVNRINQHCYK